LAEKIDLSHYGIKGVFCGGTELPYTKVSGHGTVHTYVINYTMPAPFVAPLPIAVA